MNVQMEMNMTVLMTVMMTTMMIMRCSCKATNPDILRCWWFVAEIGGSKPRGPKSESGGSERRCGYTLVFPSIEDCHHDVLWKVVFIQRVVVLGHVCPDEAARHFQVVFVAK